MTLVTSELVTNAVLHAGSAPDLVVGLHEGRLVLEVHDNSRYEPVLGRATKAVVWVEGLRLVGPPTHRRGWEPTAAGKRIWVEKHL